MEITQELKELFNVVRTKLGAPIRRVELDDNQLCALLSVAIGDYAEKVQNWIIQANWLNMNGKSINFLQNPQELAFAFTTRQLDFSRDYSYWFNGHYHTDEVHFTNQKPCITLFDRIINIEKVDDFINEKTGYKLDN